MSAETEVTTDEYYILKGGEIFGPFSRHDLSAGLEDGRFSARDFVQLTNQPIWQPLGRMLDGPQDTEAQGAIAPDWPCLSKWAWFRLRHEISAQSVKLGAVGLGLAILSAAISSWPLIFWLPGLALATAAAIALLRANRTTAGFLLLLGVAAVPIGYVALSGPRRTAPVLAEHFEVPPALTPVAPPSPVEPAAPMAAAPVSPVAPPEAKPQLPDVPSMPSEAAPPIVEASAPQAPLPVASAPPEIHPVTTPVPVMARRIGPAFPTFPPISPAATPPPPSTVVQDIMQSHRDAFVIIKGAEGSGSGFVCRVGDKTWLYTNIHVVADILQPTVTRLDNVIVSPGAAEAAPGPDIVRFAVAQAPAHPLEIIDDFATDVRIGDEVAVLGNSGGGGVVTSLEGKVVGVGPDRLEVSAEFIPGNSGSPIVHLKTGKVIGIATYLTKRPDEFGSGSSGGTPSATPAPTPAPYSGFPGPRPPFPPIAPPTPALAKKAEARIVIRRFGYRLDNVKTWEPVNWAAFRQDAKLVHQTSELTDDIFDFLGALRTRQTPQYATDALRRPASLWLSKVRAKQVSESDRFSATQSFLYTLRSLVRTDVNSAESQLRYTYFKNELQEDKRAREMLYKAFDSESADLVSSSRNGRR